MPMTLLLHFVRAEYLLCLRPDHPTTLSPKGGLMRRTRRLSVFGLVILLASSWPMAAGRVASAADRTSSPPPPSRPF